MSIEIYEGQAYRTGEDYARIDAGGRLYLSASISRQMPAGCTEIVVGNGLFPHDVTGVDYRAGRGDRKRRCTGSGGET